MSIKINSIVSSVTGAVKSAQAKVVAKSQSDSAKAFKANVVKGAKTTADVSLTIGAMVLVGPLALAAKGAGFVAGVASKGIYELNEHVIVPAKAKVATPDAEVHCTRCGHLFTEGQEQHHLPNDAILCGICMDTLMAKLNEEAMTEEAPQA